MKTQPGFEESPASAGSKLNTKVLGYLNIYYALQRVHLVKKC